MSIIKAIACGLGLAMLAPVCAMAGPMTFNLAAHVAQYCQISAPDNAAVTFQGRGAEIGAIREICNTPNGYDVRTSFSNIAGGRLQVAGNDYLIDASGSALRSNFQPAVQTLEWRVADALVVRPDDSVIMRVTITPR